MAWLAVWLIGVGAADLIRALRPTPPWMSAGVGVATMMVTALASGMTGIADGVVLLLAALPLVAWVSLSERAQRVGGGHGWALLVLGLSAAALLVTSGWASPAGGVLARWLGWADLPPVMRAGPDEALVVTGLMLVNLATANHVVRLVLISVGAMRPARLGGTTLEQPSDRLKGGRLLGPMERLVILGLGLAGQLIAASIVIAAKGLLRFPELQAKRDDHSEVVGLGIDAVTEYFLVGSFVSWIFALGSLILAR